MIDFGRIRDLARQEERLRWAVEKQMAKCTRITPTISDMPKGGGSGQRMEEDVIRLALLKEQHEAVAGELQGERRALEPYIRRLRDGTQRTAMTLRYMQNKRIGVIMDVMGYSERQVFRILERAESKVLQRFKGKEGQRKDGSTCQ